MDRSRMDQVAQQERRAARLSEARSLLALIDSGETRILSGGDETECARINAELRKRANDLIMGE